MTQAALSALFPVLEQLMPGRRLALYLPSGQPLGQTGQQGGVVPALEQLRAEVPGQLHPVGRAPLGWLWLNAPPESPGALEAALPLLEALLEARARLEQRQAEHALLLQVVNIAPQMIYVKNEHGQIILANPALSAAYQMTPEAFLEQGTRDPLFYLAPEVAQEIQANDALVRASGQTLTLEEQVTFPDGEPRWFVSTKTPFTALDGSHHLMGISSEITAQKKLEERLRLFEKAVEASSDAINIAQADGVMLYVNPASQQLFGYTPEDFAQLRGSIVVDPEVLARIQARVQRGEAVREEMKLRAKDGRELMVFQRIDLLASSARGMGLMVASATDLSAHHALERLKDEFVSLASHELRTPLTAIQGALRLVGDGVLGQIPEEASELLGIALRNAERLTRLVGDLLDLSRLEHDPFGFDTERLELYPLLERSVLEHRGYAQDLGIRLYCEGEECRAEVRGNTDRLCQVLSNLLSNAIKFTPAGQTVEVVLLERGHSVGIPVPGAPNPGWVRVEVRDRGPGIPPELRPRLFERFARASSTQHIVGTGLGLTISLSIVQKLGGQIGFEDRPGGGTVFYFELPLERVSQSA